MIVIVWEESDCRSNHEESEEAFYATGLEKLHELEMNMDGGCDWKIKVFFKIVIA